MNCTTSHGGSRSSASPKTKTAVVTFRSSTPGLCGGRTGSRGCSEPSSATRTSLGRACACSHITSFPATGARITTGPHHWSACVATTIRAIQAPARSTESRRSSHTSRPWRFATRMRKCGRWTSALSAQRMWCGPDRAARKPSAVSRPPLLAHRTHPVTRRLLSWWLTRATSRSARILTWQTCSRTRLSGRVPAGGSS